jgi:fructokinase
MLYHGSLAARSPASWQSLQWLRKHHGNNIFVDINLRAPWWSHEQIHGLVDAAHWVKLNDVELRELNNDMDMDIESLARDYARKYSLQHLILTQGSKGACLFENGAMVTGVPVNVENIVDTVGAGDAFSAIIILGEFLGWPSAVSVQRALEFSSYICGVRGATIDNHSVYAGFLAEWGSV